MLWKSGLVGEYSYFVGSILVQVRNVFLLNYLLVLSLLKLKKIGVFWLKKKYPVQTGTVLQTVV